MATLICVICEKPFEVKPSWLRNGKGKYCSLECKYKGTRKGKNVSCFICGKEVYRKLTKITSTKSGKFFCGKSCQTKWRNREYVGEKHANWSHGKNAYRGVLQRNGVLKICTLCKINDERILAVHHVDQNRLNNQVQNLAWLCHNCHFLVHHDSVERQRFLIELGKR